MFVLGLASADIVLFLGRLLPVHGRCEPNRGYVDFSDAIPFHNLDQEGSFFHVLDFQLNVNCLGPRVHLYQEALCTFLPVIDWVR